MLRSHLKDFGKRSPLTFPSQLFIEILCSAFDAAPNRIASKSRKSTNELQFTPNQCSGIRIRFEAHLRYHGDTREVTDEVHTAVEFEVRQDLIHNNTVSVLVLDP
jgi:hypothetical protein